MNNHSEPRVGSSEQYRRNYDSIFRKKEKPKRNWGEYMDARQREHEKHQRYNLDFEDKGDK